MCRLVDNAGNPDWSPTGERFAFLRIADSMLCLYYFSNKNIEPLVQGEEPSFSPDGKRIAYEWHREIFILDCATKSTRKIANGITPNWSQNGKWIAFGHPSSFKRRSTGELIQGLPNPDSSIFVYDVLAETIGRTIINHLNPPSGAEVGISYPTWILNDTYLAFATEPMVVAVPSGGGKWVYPTNLPVPVSINARSNSYLQKKTSDDPSLIGAGQLSWNPQLRMLAFYMGESRFPPGIDKKIYQWAYTDRWGQFVRSLGQSDLSWAPDSTRSLVVRPNSIYRIDVSKPSF